MGSPPRMSRALWGASCGGGRRKRKLEWIEEEEEEKEPWEDNRKQQQQKQESQWYSLQKWGGGLHQEKIITRMVLIRLLLEDNFRRIPGLG